MPDLFVLGALLIFVGLLISALLSNHTQHSEHVTPVTDWKKDQHRVVRRHQRVQKNDHARVDRHL